MSPALHKSAALFILLLAMPTFANELTRITLDNGAVVQLNDDFTWEYVILTSQRPDTQKATIEQTSSATAANTTSNTTASTFTQATSGSISNPVIPATELASTPNIDQVPTLTQAAITQAALLKSTAKGDVKISYIKHQWDDDRLGLTFELSSNSPEHYVMIALEISLFADDGHLLKQQTVKVWKAIFRMPETYLRKGETRSSNIIWIDGIDQSQWSKQLISLKIKKMDSRM
ncbi:DUF3157 family protein [Shewanella intestini]|uniref:DUF3157 family protein n=1 Tax=Shewanella intestini TaxID=2017544 RepID=A0ABS5I573_9GAMM|nr:MULTISPECIES: DUF3157 family protein [Shewanella]MBR9729172.1 DUF3157 family protein [Shewanella intestini]MRG37257.1 DUF3157 family protein [Shewanella sp. XMDDZSB0408]